MNNTIRLRKEFCCSGDGWEVNTFLRSGRFLVECHYGKCSCSYCTRIRWPVALWLPECKSWNAWRIVAIRLWRSNWYIRWTGTP
jgi:hypothetical protein